MTPEERRERHEWQCKSEVVTVEGVRRWRGRWQVARGRLWRDLDPVVTYPSGAELEALP